MQRRESILNCASAEDTFCILPINNTISVKNVSVTANYRVDQN